MKKSKGLFLIALALVSGCSLSALNPFGSKEKNQTLVQDQGVNHYLWQATLDKLGFMGVETADKQSGVIVFKWAKMQGVPDEMFKVRVGILCRELRSDGLKVTVLKRVKSDGQWNAGGADKKLAVEIENQILLQARKLYRKDLLTNKE